MREYEIVYIFRSNFTPEEIEAKVERYHAILTRDGKGEITAVEQWGKRQLAFPIEKQPNGYYLVAQFNADPAVLPELERMLKLEEDLLRYLIVLSEGELPIPGSMQSEMDDRVGPGGPPRRDNDDEKRPEPASTADEAKDGEADAEDSGDGEADADDADDADDDTDADVADGEEATEEAAEASDGEEAADADGDGEADPDPDDGEEDSDADAGDDEADGDAEPGNEDADEEAEEAAEKED